MFSPPPLGPCLLSVMRLFLSMEHRPSIRPWTVDDHDVDPFTDPADPDLIDPEPRKDVKDVLVPS